jgi:hypothetical protein
MKAGVEFSDAQPIVSCCGDAQRDADLAAPKLVTSDGATVWADPSFDETRRPAVGIATAGTIPGSTARRQRRG